MKHSYLLVAATAAAATVRWANDDELAVMSADRGKVGTALAMQSAVEMQTMEVERMFNITLGLVPIEKMRDIWDYHGQNPIQPNRRTNQPPYELQNQLPADTELSARGEVSARQVCPNHNGDFNGFYGVRFHLGPHIGAQTSGYAPCGTGGPQPDDAAKGSFGYQLNRAAGDHGAARVQFCTIEDAHKANILGGSMVYETVGTDTCPEYIALDGCEE